MLFFDVMFIYLQLIVILINLHYSKIVFTFIFFKLLLQKLYINYSFIIYLVILIIGQYLNIYICISLFGVF